MTEKKGPLAEVREGDHLRLIGKNSNGEKIAVLHHLDGTADLVVGKEESSQQGVRLELEPCPGDEHQVVYHVGSSRSDSAKGSINRRRFCENWDRINWRNKKPTDMN